VGRVKIDVGQIVRINMDDSATTKGKSNHLIEDPEQSLPNNPWQGADSESCSVCALRQQCMLVTAGGADHKFSEFGDERIEVGSCAR